MELESAVLGFFEFVGNINFASFGNILLITLVIFWLVVVGWVWADAGERTSKKGLRVLYLVIVLVLNVPGLLIYLIIRPSETIEEIYWADLERRYLKYETSELGDCPSCGAQLYPGMVFCSDCGHELKKKCPSCEMLMDKDNKYCTQCGTQIARRVRPEEEYPTVEVMEQQILASKEEAAETVEGKRTRYKSGKSIVVKVGDSIISFLGLIRDGVGNGIKKLTTKKEKEQENVKPVKKAEKKNDSKKKSKKKKKKNKRK